MSAKDPLSETQIAERVAVRLGRNGGRWIENVAAIVGLGNLAFIGFAEAQSLTACTEARFPWANLIIGAICVLPKTVGRATAGRVWDVLANRIGGKGQ